MALYELSDEEVEIIESAAKAVSYGDPTSPVARIANLTPTEVKVMAYVEGGIVQYARATSSVDFSVIDYDTFEHCATIKDDDGEVIGCGCPEDATHWDRDAHADAVDALKRYRELPKGVY